MIMVASYFKSFFDYFDDYTMLSINLQCSKKGSDGGEICFKNQVNLSQSENNLCLYFVALLDGKNKTKQKNKQKANKQTKQNKAKTKQKQKQKNKTKQNKIPA